MTSGTVAHSLYSSSAIRSLVKTLSHLLLEHVILFTLSHLTICISISTWLLVTACLCSFQYHLHILNLQFLWDWHGIMLLAPQGTSALRCCATTPTSLALLLTPNSGVVPELRMCTQMFTNSKIGSRVGGKENQEWRCVMMTIARMSSLYAMPVTMVNASPVNNVSLSQGTLLHPQLGYPSGEDTWRNRQRGCSIGAYLMTLW